MSLKHFHIAFVTITVLFFAGLAAWCLLVTGLPEMYRIMGWISAVCAVGMFVYGILFLKKVRTLIH